MSAKRTVTVRILGQDHRIRGDRDPEAVRRAAALVDETVALLRSRTATVDSRELALLAALNLAHQVVALRDGEDAQRATAGEPARLAELVALLESAVGEAAPARH